MSVFLIQALPLLASPHLLAAAWIWGWRCNYEDESHMIRRVEQEDKSSLDPWWYSWADALASRLPFCEINRPLTSATVSQVFCCIWLNTVLTDRHINPSESNDFVCLINASLGTWLKVISSVNIPLIFHPPPHSLLTYPEPLWTPSCFPLQTRKGRVLLTQCSHSTNLMPLSKPYSITMLYWNGCFLL